MTTGGSRRGALVAGKQDDAAFDVEQSQPPPFPEIDGGRIFCAAAASAQTALERPPKAVKPDEFSVTTPVSIEVNARPIALFRQPRSRQYKVRLAAISQRADPDLFLPRLWRPVGAAARCQGRALHRHLRQGRLVHRPHQLSRPRNDRARRCRGLPDARPRRQADHRARLVRHRVARGRRPAGLCRHRAHQPAAALRFLQGIYALARRSGAAAAGGAEAALQQGDWRRW